MPDLGSFARSGTILLAATFAVGPVAAQTDTTAVPAVRFNALEVVLAGRVQTQFNTSSVDTVPASEILLRRVRLEATVKVSDFVSGKVQPEFAGERVTVADAFLRLRLSSAFEVLAGRAHRPFGIMTPLSSVRILPIERGASIRGIAPLEEHNLVRGLGYSDRDVGLQIMGTLRGAPLGLTYAVGYFDGPLRPQTGSNADDPDQLVGRLSAMPVKGLRVGASASTREFRTIDTLEERHGLKRGTAWGLDAEWGTFADGFHVLGELAWGAYDPRAETDFVGTQVWIGYRTKALGPLVAHLEPVLRVSTGDLRGSASAARARRGGTLLTPGINLYFDPLNRAMANWDFWRSHGDGNLEHSFKAMLQFAF